MRRLNFNKDFLHRARKGFCIKRHYLTKLGYIEQVLAKDNVWYIASNDCNFRTLYQAREFFLNSNHDSDKVFIYSPRGKHYEVLPK